MVYKTKMPQAYARVEWCKELFGGSGEPNYDSINDIVKGLRWWWRMGYIYFRNEEDYVLYTLRWAC